MLILGDAASRAATTRLFVGAALDPLPAACWADTPGTKCTTSQMQIIAAPRPRIPRCLLMHDPHSRTISTQGGKCMTSHPDLLNSF